MAVKFGSGCGCGMVGKQ